MEVPTEADKMNAVMQVEDNDRALPYIASL